MGVFDKFKEFVGIEDVDEDDLDYEEDEEEEVKSIIPDEKKTAERPITHPVPAPQRVDGPRPSVNTRNLTSQFKMVVTEPTGFEECPRLVDNLKARKPVIINLENLETDSARKIFDFLSGATYALNGNVQKVANNIFIFAPENVDVAFNMQQKAAQNESIKSPWK